jgi:large repetitive protein
MSAEKAEMNLVICLAIVLAALAPPPEIAGTVVDYNGKPVSGVTISLVGVISEDRLTKNTVSASDGSFSFTGLAPGGYGLVAKTDAACAMSDAIWVNVGFTRVVRLRLTKGYCYGSALHFAEPPGV